MAKASINTGSTGEGVHTRTTAGTEESQAVVIGIDGSDNVVLADANGLLVQIAAPVTITGLVESAPVSSGVGATTSVASTVTANTTLFAADASRVHWSITNESTSTLTVLIGGGTQSTTVYTVKIPPAGYFEAPPGCASLRVSGNWATANGSARILAVTA